MSNAGRPSVEEEDRKEIVYMAELWCAGNSGLSIRKISRIVVGLEAASSTGKPKHSSEEDVAMKPQPSSVAKRLERRFLKLEKDVKAEGLSVYRVREQERKIAMKALGAITYGSFHQNNTMDPTFILAEKEANIRTAARCGIDATEVLNREYPRLCVWGLAHAIETDHLLNRSG